MQNKKPQGNVMHRAAFIKFNLRMTGQKTGKKKGSAGINTALIP